MVMVNWAIFFFCAVRRGLRGIRSPERLLLARQRRAGKEETSFHDWKSRREDTCVESWRERESGMMHRQDESREREREREGERGREKKGKSRY
jgi:hypothetical protein